MSAASVKVRASAISWRKLSGVSRSVRACRPIAAARNSIDSAMLEAGTAGAQLGECLALRDPDGAQDLDLPARRVLLDDAGAINQENQRSGRAIDDRQFRPVDLGEGIVDAAARQCGHQVLDRAEPQIRLIGHAEHGA